MIVLGLSNNDYAGVCLIIDGIIVSAAHEERFTRIKAHSTFPQQAIDYVLSENNLKLDDIDLIAYGWKAGFNEYKHLELYFDRIAEASIREPQSLPYLRHRLYDEIHNDTEKRQEFDRYIQDNALGSKVVYIDHHEAHANAAFLCSPFSNGITISCDGRGDFQSLTVSEYTNGQFNVLHRETTFDSLGYFYGRITKLLGFKPNRHEGKITGLASYGDPKKLLPLMAEFIDINEEGRIRAKFGTGYLPSYHNDYDVLQARFANEKPEDIAAAAQQHLENILTAIVKQYVSNKNPQNLCLAGGVFGNVKLNQRLRELDGVKNIYVLPSMGDDGLPLGSAVCALYNRTGLRVKTPSMKIGPNIETSEEIITQIESNSQYACIKSDQAHTIVKIINALKNNKVLGFAKGRMEFGPRALCSRSIVCSAKDVTINKWLNERMNRTEFMPFAPITADVFASDCFVGWKSEHIASHFMTVTYDCTEYFALRCPAVTHIDRTARPQVITQHSDPFMFKILVEWEASSGEPSLINTSFNIHEEPIINNMHHALANLDRGVVDILVFNEDLLVWNSKNVQLGELLHG
ncbi:carbamoyltransferase C-terminal domain-containing protein [Xenorhabdus sp. TH1]|uniref:carbamoyltransferase C-terminal domain-containing protein n=1 Tax=Xenorhabdus sp. TH1 TaxID=3130166 RepID=UPI0030CAD1E1